MKRKGAPGALLSLPLLLALLVAPPPSPSPAPGGVSRTADFAQLDPHAHTLHVDPHFRLPFAPLSSSSSSSPRVVPFDRSEEEEEEEEQDGKQEEKRVVSTTTTTTSNNAPAPPVVVTPRALVLMLDYLHAARGNPARMAAVLRGLQSALAAAKTGPVRLPYEAFAAKPEALHALAQLYARAFSASAPTERAIVKSLRVPDPLLLPLACVALDRNVTEHLLATREEASDPSSVDTIISTPPVDAPAMLRMLRDYPALRRYGRLAGPARRDVQLAWFDHTRRDRNLAERHAFERWLFNTEMSPDVQRLVLDAYARRDPVVLANGYWHPGPSSSSPPPPPPPPPSIDAYPSSLAAVA